MGLSEIPPPVEVTPGYDLPELRTPPPGPQSRTWLTRYSKFAVPMGPKRASGRGGVLADVPPATIVLAQGRGCNVIDVDSNRYVDLAAGFGSLPLGHQHESLTRALTMQSNRLSQGLGDVYPSDAKIGLLERLARLHPTKNAQSILGQSGADAITAALKTAQLATGKPGVVAFSSSYHGLNYAALSLSDLRASYREPFADQLSPHVTFADYPTQPGDVDRTLSQVEQACSSTAVGAIVVEPILGRGGVVVPPSGFLPELTNIATRHGALLVSDEIWTGLGRAGSWLAGDSEPQFAPDLICLGKGLGGGLPISACLGAPELMECWSRQDEVVHTSTFAGAPLACTAALCTLDVLGRKKWIEHAAATGSAWIEHLRGFLSDTAISDVRGRGLMIGLSAEQVPGGATALQRALLERGFITTTGGGKRDVLVLTPPLNISSDLLMAFEDSLRVSLMILCARGR